MRLYDTWERTDLNPKPAIRYDLIRPLRGRFEGNSGKLDFVGFLRRLKLDGRRDGIGGGSLSTIIHGRYVVVIGLTAGDVGIGPAQGIAGSGGRLSVNQHVIELVGIGGAALVGSTDSALTLLPVDPPLEKVVGIGVGIGSGEGCAQEPIVTRASDPTSMIDAIRMMDTIRLTGEAACRLEQGWLFI